MKRMFHRASSLVHQRRRQFSSTSFGIVGEDFSVVEHTPIFSQVVSKLMLGDSRPKFLLDMTFGSGGHTNLLLDHKPDLVDQIVVCDCDRVSYNEAKELRARNNKVLPIRTKFHKLLNVLLDHGITPGCFDGILIDTGCSTFQWADTKRGFCPNKAGLLDLRYDPCPSVPTASEVLQNITDRDLLRLLRAYSGLGPNVSKYVTNTIIESRYMFHRFQTTQELYEVLKTAARTYCLDKDLDQEREMSSMMMKETLNALKLFVNNDVNELQFAVNQVAKNFLKPQTGVLVTIVNSTAEQKVVESCLKEADVTTDLRVEDDHRSWLPWKLIYQQPQELTPAEKTLNPRLQHAKLYAATLDD